MLSEHKLSGKTGLYWSLNGPGRGGSFDMKKNYP
jgi:hypothetical protein